VNNSIKTVVWVALETYCSNVFWKYVALRKRILQKLKVNQCIQQSGTNDTRILILIVSMFRERFRKLGAA
jgi:hypothetical protein